MKKVYLKLAVKLMVFSSFLVCCENANSSKKETNEPKPEKEKMTNTSGEKLDTATFGAGCFWCVEAVFQQLDGVKSVASGYSGGAIKNPSYKEVCSGTTGHAEVCQIVYDSNKISFTEMLEAFFGAHDPTTMNQQGNDRGTQYRSAIFYHNEEQRKTAEEIKAKLNKEKVFPNPVVTEIVAFDKFYKAEDYHQNYYSLNGDQPYCQYVIQPKLEKFKKVFKEKLKH